VALVPSSRSLGSSKAYLSALRHECWSKERVPYMHFEFTVFGTSIHRVLLLTKSSLLRVWLGAQLPTAGTAVVVTHGVPSARQLDLLRNLVKRLGAPVGFIGDLDPLDLMAFQGYEASLGAKYLGIDDEWIALCRRTALQPVRIAIQMNRRERQQLLQLGRLLPRLEVLVGNQAAALLRSGRKIEIEGVSNPLLYPERFEHRLFGLARKKAAEAEGR